MKRKVTDLKPNEAILISNHTERNSILNLMDKAAWKWNDGSKPFDVLIRNRFPYCLAYKFEGTDGFSNRGIRVVDYDYEGNCVFYPATDFIGSEGDMERGITIVKQNGEVISAETVLLSEIRNKLTPIKNLIAMLESGFIAPSGSQELIYKELEQCKVNIEELTRNTPTNEHPNQP
jgi:hypothetical protein